MTFIMDTGTSVNVMPLKLFNKFTQFSNLDKTKQMRQDKTNGGKIWKGVATIKVQVDNKNYLFTVVIVKLTAQYLISLKSLEGVLRCI